MLTSEIVNDIELVYRALWDQHEWKAGPDEDLSDPLDIALMNIDAWMDDVRSDHIAQAAETERNRILDIIVGMDPEDYSASGFRRRIVAKITETENA